MCGLELHVEEQHVTLIRADRDDVWSKGFLCPKGTTLGHLYEDPDRIREPMIRAGDQWREVSWDEAFARCEELLLGVRERHGIGAMTAYIGNPTVHNFSLSRYVGLLIGLAGFPMIYSAGTVDQWPKNVACALMYGGMWDIPAPDLQRTDYFLVLGANPHASQGSLLACPDVLGEIDKIRERGGRTVVVDPRRTGTADRADEWVPIVPGTDAALLLAIVNVLFADRLVDLGDVADLVAGVEKVEAAARPFTPEVVADACGVPATKIREIAHDLADRAERRDLRPHRALQPGVRHRRDLAGRHRLDPLGQLRPPGRHHVRQAHRMVARDAPQPDVGRRLRLRSMDEPGARRTRGPRSGGGLVPCGGDRDAW